MADLILTISFGVYPEIFPWGAEVLRKYLEVNDPDVDVRIWDLHDDEQVLGLFAQYRDCISNTIQFLSRAKRYIGQRYPVITKEESEHWPRRAYYLAVMLQFGKDIFSILENENIPIDANFRKKFEKQFLADLQEYKTEKEQEVRTEIKELENIKKTKIESMKKEEDNLV